MSRWPRVPGHHAMLVGHQPGTQWRQAHHMRLESTRGQGVLPAGLQGRHGPPLYARVHRLPQAFGMRNPGCSTSQRFSHDEDTENVHAQDVHQSWEYLAVYEFEFDAVSVDRQEELRILDGDVSYKGGRECEPAGISGTTSPGPHTAHAAAQRKLRVQREPAEYVRLPDHDATVLGAGVTAAAAGPRGSGSCSGGSGGSSGSCGSGCGCVGWCGPGGSGGAEPGACTPARTVRW